MLIISGFLNGQKGYQCRWRSNPSSDFQLPDLYYSSWKKGAVLYCLTNDGSNIYLDMKIRETLEQNRILKSGMTLWIDVEGKTRKRFGVRYPIGSDYTRMGRKPGEMQMGTPLSMANTIQLIGFRKERPAHIPSNSSEGIRGSVKYDNDGNLIYRLVVPISDIEGYSKDSGKVLNMCIEYGAPPPELSKVSSGIPSGGGMGGGMPPGGGGGRGGGRGGGGGGRGGGEGMPGGGMPGGGLAGAPGSQPSQPPVNIWVKKVTLSSEN